VLMVTGSGRRWHQRHDRVHDDVRTYSPGVDARLELARDMTHPRDPMGVLVLDGRVVGELDRPDASSERADLRLADGQVVHLQERVEILYDGRRGELALRLADAAGSSAVEMHGERRGDQVDWTVPPTDGDPGPELRLRQRLAAVPSRRTLLGHDGRAWLVRADHEANRWSGTLPSGTSPVRAAAVLWLCAHLDRVGVARSYPPSAVPPGLVTADGNLTAHRSRVWVPVGAPLRRPSPPDPD
jgi:hypothetical protein